MVLGQNPARSFLREIDPIDNFPLLLHMLPVLLWSHWYMMERWTPLLNTNTQQWAGDWGTTGLMPAPLFWVCFHSIRQYSLPCSASRDRLLWCGEWRSAGASPLPLITALCSSAPRGVKVKALKKKKEKGKKESPSVWLPPLTSIVAFLTWKGVVYSWMAVRVAALLLQKEEFL